MFRTAAGRLAHTYSIVARDPDTGEMGVAVQSHWFSVGSVVAWAAAGAGAVATQSMVNPLFGPLGLELLRNGRTAAETVAEAAPAAETVAETAPAAEAAETVAEAAPEAETVAEAPKAE